MGLADTPGDDNRVALLATLPEVKLTGRHGLSPNAEALLGAVLASRQPQQQQLWQQHPEWEIVAHEAFHWWRRGPALGEGPDQGLHERVSHDDVSGEHAVGLRDKKEEQLQGKGAYSDC